MIDPDKPLYEESNPKTAMVVMGGLILIVLLVIGAFVYINNQNIERERIEKEEKASIESQRQAENELKLSTCLVESENTYNGFVELNATSTEETPDGTVYTAPQEVWDRAKAQQEKDNDECYDLYGS